VIGGQHTRLERIDAAGGADYGVLFLQSSDSTLVNSTLHGGQVAGLYIGESLDARVTVTGNRIFDNGILGIFIRNASRGVITHNRVQDGCIGVGFISTNQDENAVRDWRASHNLVTANNQLCNAGGGR
jgi:parallel beta-helix repeat protein